MTRTEQALDCFHNMFNCSQAVFSSFCEEGGLKRETSLKIACSFGAGMANTGQTCGAVTGAYMVIGLLNGKYLAEDNSSKEKTYNLVREFTTKFKERYGSVNCTELIGCDLTTEEGYNKARDEGRFRKYCDNFVKGAVEILEELK